MTTARLTIVCVAYFSLLAVFTAHGWKLDPGWNNTTSVCSDKVLKICSNDSTEFEIITEMITGKSTARQPLSTSIEDTWNRLEAKVFCFSQTNNNDTEIIVNSTLSCWVFSSKFISCVKWILTSKEYEYNDKTIHASRHNKSYTIGEYYIDPYSQDAYVCIPSEVSSLWLCFLDFVVIAVLCLSILALTVSIAVHIIVLRHKQNVKPIICHKLSLIIVYIGTILTGWNIPIQHTSSAWILQAFGYFGIPAAFCWLNVISFDLWQKFHPVTMFRRHSSSLSVPHTEPRFVFQALYAWGLPATVLFIIAPLLRFTGLPVLSEWAIKGPLFSNVAQITVMLAEITIIITVNLVFFSLIVRNMNNLKKGSPKRRHSILQPNFACIYLKLMVASGIIWILEIIRWISIHCRLQSDFWVLIDILCGAQGVWLFLIYCCNSSVIKLLKKTYKKSESDIKIVDTTAKSF